jgi:hypothetical protein
MFERTQPCTATVRCAHISSEKKRPLASLASTLTLTLTVSHTSLRMCGVIPPEALPANQGCMHNEQAHCYCASFQATTARRLVRKSAHASPCDNTILTRCDRCTTFLRLQKTSPWMKRQAPTAKDHQKLKQATQTVTTRPWKGIKNHTNVLQYRFTERLVWFGQQKDKGSIRVA